MTLPTPTEFLAMPSDPDEDGPDLDPLHSIAESLRQIAAARAGTALPAPSDEWRAHERELGELLQDAERKLDEIRALVKPSTSKLANGIRDVLDPPADDESEETGDDEPETTVPPPAHDATVGEWRDYARGLQDPGADTYDLEQMNRSQIRTMLGIEHGGS